MVERPHVPITAMIEEKELTDDEVVEHIREIADADDDAEILVVHLGYNRNVLLAKMKVAELQLSNPGRPTKEYWRRMFPKVRRNLRKAHPEWSRKTLDERTRATLGSIWYHKLAPSTRAKYERVRRLRERGMANPPFMAYFDNRQTEAGSGVLLNAVTAKDAQFLGHVLAEERGWLLKKVERVKGPLPPMNIWPCPPPESVPGYIFEPGTNPPRRENFLVEFTAGAVVGGVAGGYATKKWLERKPIIPQVKAKARQALHLEAPATPTQPVQAAPAMATANPPEMAPLTVQATWGGGPSPTFWSAKKRIAHFTYWAAQTQTDARLGANRFEHAATERRTAREAWSQLAPRDADALQRSLPYTHEYLFGHHDYRSSEAEALGLLAAYEAFRHVPGFQKPRLSYGSRKHYRMWRERIKGGSKRRRNDPTHSPIGAMVSSLAQQMGTSEAEARTLVSIYNREIELGETPERAQAKALEIARKGGVAIVPPVVFAGPDGSDPVLGQAILDMIHTDARLGRMWRRIAQTLAERVKRGTYDPERAVRYWRVLVDEASRKWNQRHGDGQFKIPSHITPMTREWVARVVNAEFQREEASGGLATILSRRQNIAPLFAAFAATEAQPAAPASLPDDLDPAGQVVVADTLPQANPPRRANLQKCQKCGNPLQYAGRAKNPGKGKAYFLAYKCPSCNSFWRLDD